MSLLATTVLLFSAFDTNITLRDFNAQRQIDFPLCHIWRFDVLAVHATCSPMVISQLSGPLRPGTPFNYVQTFDLSVFYTREDCRLITTDPIVFDCFDESIFQESFEWP